MKILKSKNLTNVDFIKGINQNHIRRISREVFKISKDDNSDSLYDKFYESKYPVFDYSVLENDLDSYLNDLSDFFDLNLSKQGDYYQWVKINFNNWANGLGYRFYLAPKPNNMYEMVKRLSCSFLKNDVCVAFKYQLQRKLNNCDRIIIYSDLDNKDKIEKSIKEVYENNFELFIGSERPISWTYESSVPNVYIQPETYDDSYGMKFASAMINAKLSFNYLYGLTNKNNSLSLVDDEAVKAYQNMDLLVSSSLLRSGLLFSKDYKKIVTQEQNIKTFYDYSSGKLTNSNFDDTDYSFVTYYPTEDGRKAFLENFYCVSSVEKQPDVEVGKMSKIERIKQREEELRERCLKRYERYKVRGKK